jgi:hypothetical protein
MFKFDYNCFLFFFADVQAIIIVTEGQREHFIWFVLDCKFADFTVNFTNLTNFNNETVKSKMKNEINNFIINYMLGDPKVQCTTFNWSFFENIYQ